MLEPIGKYIDFFIKDFVPIQETYVRDSMYMINLVDGQPYNHETDWLATLDISSLYTNIPQEESILIIEQLLETRTRPIQVPTSFIVSLLRIALQFNYFASDGSYYQQCPGTSMGAIFAPNLANIYMDHVE